MPATVKTTTTTTTNGTLRASMAQAPMKKRPAKAPPAAKQEAAGVALFYSKSKDADTPFAEKCGGKNWRKYLSNFTLVPGGLVIGGTSWPSVEHYFQAMKWRLATNKPNGAKAFTRSDLPPAEAKRKGGKAAMKAEGAELNFAKWKEASGGVMRSAVEARYEQDGRFARILNAAKQEKLRLVHFERSGAKSHWGAHVDWAHENKVLGGNALGVTMSMVALGVNVKFD